MQMSIAIMMKMAIGTPKSPIKRRICGRKTANHTSGTPSQFCTLSSYRIGSYWARQEMTGLENTQEVRDGEAAKHQAHGQQGGVGVGPFDLQLVNGDVAVGMVLHVLLDNGDEGVVHGAV